ncbi:MAG: cache domain-containing protein [Blastochloris sp.]|nr:cache domain-containing protein [Blastochloris sp.]
MTFTTILVLGVIIYQVSSKELIITQKEKLVGLRNTVKISIEQFFFGYQAALLTHTSTPTVHAAVKDFTLARASILSEMQTALPSDISSTWVGEIRRKNLDWADKLLIPQFNKIRGKAVTPDQIVPLQDEAIVMQYFYTVTNPAALGQKAENNESGFITANAAIPLEYRTAFQQTTYSRLIDQYHPFFKKVLAQLDLYDILMLDTQGNLVYSVQKETDFGANIYNAHNSPLADIYRKASSLASASKDKRAGAAFSSFVDYQPSYDAPSLFVAAPVSSDDGTFIGVIIFQLNPSTISRALTFDSKYKEVGLGKTGEAYLLNKDSILCTDPRYPRNIKDNSVKRPLVTIQGIQEEPSVALRLKDLSNAAKSAFSSSDVAEYTNYAGNQVLGAFDSIELGDEKLALITQMDKNEILAPVGEITKWSAIAGAGTLVLGLGLSFLFSGRLAKPIVSLSQTAEAVAGGDLKLRAKKESQDEVGQLVDQFNAMLDQINARAEQSKKIMQTVTEALILLDTKFIIQPEYSLSTESILRKNLEGSNFLNVLRGILSEKQFTNARDFFDILMDPRKKEKLIQQTNPLSEVEFNIDNGNGGFRTKILEFRFNRILEGTEIRQLLVTIVDITSRVQLQREMLDAEKRAESQVELLFGIMHVEPRQLKDFLDTAETELGKIQQELKSEEARLKIGEEDADTRTARFRELLERLGRPVHMVKGNASILQLGFFVKQSHKLEDRMKEINDRDEIRGEDFLIVVVSLSELLAQLEMMRTLIGRIISMNKAFGAAASNSKAAGSGNTENALGSSESVEFSFGASAAQESELATYLTKQLETFVLNTAAKYGKEVSVTYQNKLGARLAPAFEKPIVQIITQLVRNSLVHGLETPAERALVGKGSLGALNVELLKIEGQRVRITVKDDGQGLNYDKIRSMAREKNLVPAQELLGWSDEKLATLIFTTGFSTEETTSEDAGRGVGLDAVKVMVRDLQGQISLRSVRHESCEFVITIPV